MPTFKTWFTNSVHQLNKIYLALLLFSSLVMDSLVRTFFLLQNTTFTKFLPLMEASINFINIVCAEQSFLARQPIYTIHYTAYLCQMTASRCFEVFEVDSCYQLCRYSNILQTCFSIIYIVYSRHHTKYGACLHVTLSVWGLVVSEEDNLERSDWSSHQQMTNERTAW